MLIVIRPVLDNSVESLDNRMYGLRKKPQHFGGRAASNVANFVKKLRSQLVEKKVNESNPISILNYLEEFTDAFNSISAYEWSLCGLSRIS